MSSADELHKLLQLKDFREVFADEHCFRDHLLRLQPKTHSMPKIDDGFLEALHLSAPPSIDFGGYCRADYKLPSGNVHRVLPALVRSQLLFSHAQHQMRQRGKPVRPDFRSVQIETQCAAWMMFRYYNLHAPDSMIWEPVFWSRFRSESELKTTLQNIHDTVYLLTGLLDACAPVLQRERRMSQSQNHHRPEAHPER